MAQRPPTSESSALAAMVRAQTTVDHPAPDDLAAHLAMVRDMRDREAIRDLALLYTRAVDDYDLEALLDLFTDDGVFERRGKAAAGREGLRQAYTEAMRANRTMVHIPDSHVVQLLPGRRATGWAAGHAELVIESSTVLAAFRYEDDYRCVDDRWRFERRSLTFKYAVPADQLADGLAGSERMRWPGGRATAADYPESLPTWAEFHS
ncbi:nuclear transport factor 2 family protein [Saccharopolyspora sp. TS4A08]|uniref:Nuclear transport factor 2 family protein n=1 Tax=Saccharopolyspora ipomoeae TaxID=3042027 RepID=A0ABT6PIE6_9PSEU|nr:nuclear transport factor 2 family protein [Saccharopolyspora sp. TS4A08]MDI2027760.1 nuclear transport factor 2 family protein [Saccharopolyspora sp. TS4A08]